MDTCNAFITFYYTHQKRFKSTHAKSLSNFIKPNNSVLNAHTQLSYRILLTQYHQPFESPIQRVQQILLKPIQAL